MAAAAIQPIGEVHAHILDQIEQRGYFKSKDDPRRQSLEDVQRGAAHIQRQDLHISISIEDIYEIDPKSGTFKVRFMIYLTWEINLQSLLKKSKSVSYADDVNDEGINICKKTKLAEDDIKDNIIRGIIEKSLNHEKEQWDLDEIEKSVIIERYFLPILSLQNRVFIQNFQFAGEHGGMRVYGGNEGRTGIIQIKEYNAKCHQEFSLENFPFDFQELKLIFRLADTRVYDKFHLRVNAVQFSQRALHLTEWIVHTPLIRIGSPSHAVCSVCLQIERQPGYYYTNVFAMLTLLSSLGLIAFMVDPAKEQGARAVITVTLMLTAYAFRFSVNEYLPAVPYSTHMDYYILGTIYLLALITFLCLFPSWISDDESLMFAVNLALGLLCAALQVAFTLWWLVRGFHLVNAHELTKRIEIIGKKWYSYRYHDTEFMTELAPEHEFKIDRKLSSTGSLLGLRM